MVVHKKVRLQTAYSKSDTDDDHNSVANYAVYSCFPVLLFKISKDSLCSRDENLRYKKESIIFIEEEKKKHFIVKNGFLARKLRGNVTRGLLFWRTLANVA